MNIHTTLKLSKCAYIFDSTHQYWYSDKYSRAVENELKKYYDEEELRNKPIKCVVDDQNNIFIDLLGSAHRLNDLQIAEIDLPDNIINYRRIFDPHKIASHAPHFELFCHHTFYSKKFKSLSFEFFTDKTDLGYIRVNFKGKSECFIVDDRTGEIYTDGKCGRHMPSDAKFIMNRLDIASVAAKNEFMEIINLITYAPKED